MTIANERQAADFINTVRGIAGRAVMLSSADVYRAAGVLHGGDVVDEVRRLKASVGPALHIWGSSELLQTLIAAELIDEHHMWVFPLVLGKGKRLFENGVPPRGLALVETRSTPKGVLINAYRPNGRIKTRSV